MKDKEWLKEKVQTMIDEEYRCYEPLIQQRKHTCRVIMDLIDQLDEPQKPVIPQFVADYIELNKGWSEDRQEYIEDDSSGLWFALDGNSYGMPNSVSDWLFNEEKVETFAKAWIYGYEVEKEKLYRVELPNMQWDDESSELKKYTAFLAFDVTSHETTFCNSISGYRGYRTDLTETQIKAIDERYWEFAEEVTE